MSNSEQRAVAAQWRSTASACASISLDTAAFLLAQLRIYLARSFLYLHPICSQHQLLASPSMTSVLTAPSSASVSSSNALPALSESDYATVHPENLSTGEAVTWGALEDGFCCVCEEGDGSEENPIVFCDSCDMSVHAHCYGNPLGQSPR